MSKNSNLKKKIGEQTYNFLSRNYGDDFLAEHLPSIFGLLSDMRHIKEGDLDSLKTILNKKFDTTVKAIPPTKTAKELLDEVGYVLHDNISTKREYLVFKKFYEKGEELCKFRADDGYNATKRYNKVFWIIKKDAENIKRLENPDRQDEYSTSCMSVGISKDRSTVAQICSRYNHAVKGCDNTFNSNLDNIAEGLTAAFNIDYKLNIKKTQEIELQSFYVSNGKYFYYSYEINGRKFGGNTIDGVSYDASKFLVFDNFILDIKNRTIKTVDDSTDGFIDTMTEMLLAGNPIQIIKGEPPLVEIDHEDKIVFYVN